jgi:two-component system chemotaxis response regulator CheY
MKILLVDDSAFMRNMIKNILKPGNHEIIEAGNFDEAVNAYKESRPDIVFLDVVMPGKSGVDALREIINMDKSAYVVMCTSIGGQQKIIDDSVAAGATDFIVKPFKPEDILKAVDNAHK